jgi:hypothetical protein
MSGERIKRAKKMREEKYEIPPLNVSHDHFPSKNIFSLFSLILLFLSRSLSKKGKLRERKSLSYLKKSVCEMERIKAYNAIKKTREKIVEINLTLSSTLLMMLMQCHRRRGRRFRNFTWNIEKYLNPYSRTFLNKWLYKWAIKHSRDDNRHMKLL